MSFPCGFIPDGVIEATLETISLLFCSDLMIYLHFLSKNKRMSSSFKLYNGRATKQFLRINCGKYKIKLTLFVVKANFCQFSFGFTENGFVKFSNV